jgi:hypothetical protein
LSPFAQAIKKTSAFYKGLIFFLRASNNNCISAHPNLAAGSGVKASSAKSEIGSRVMRVDAIGG